MSGVTEAPAPPLRPRDGGVTLTVGVALDADHVVAVDRLRRRLELAPAAPRSVPHITLLVVADADLDALGAICADVASRTTPFTVTARGLAVFQSPARDLVLYVPVVRTPQLDGLHGELHDRATAVGARIDGHCSPAAWFPHITLQRQGVTPARLAAALDELAGRGGPIAWTVPVTRLIELTPEGPLRTAAFPRPGLHPPPTSPPLLVSTDRSAP